MTKLTIAEAAILGQALTFLSAIKEQDGDSPFAEGLVRGLVTSIGSFTRFGNIYFRLSDLEDQIKRPVKRRLP